MGLLFFMGSVMESNPEFRHSFEPQSFPPFGRLFLAPPFDRRSKPEMNVENFCASIRAV
jgi:hypothetical protein